MTDFPMWLYSLLVVRQAPIYPGGRCNCEPIRLAAGGGGGGGVVGRPSSVGVCVECLVPVHLPLFSFLL
jgi:hypothetical protein